jgi:hypothetical protein
MSFSIEKIEAMIYSIRGQRVMLDSDLSKLYGVETKTLIRQVKRNISRFPEDFLFIPSSSELEDLRYQIGTANYLTVWNHMRRSEVMLFTENGVAMLSSVLGSEQAVQINIVIIRTFTKLRSFSTLENSDESRLEKLESGQEDTKKLFKIVFHKLDSLDEQISPKLPANRKKIGLKSTLKNYL